MQMSARAILCSLLRNMYIELHVIPSLDAVVFNITHSVIRQSMSFIRREVFQRALFDSVVGHHGNERLDVLPPHVGNRILTLCRAPSATKVPAHQLGTVEAEADFTDPARVLVDGIEVDVVAGGRGLEHEAPPAHHGRVGLGDAYIIGEESVRDIVELQVAAGRKMCGRLRECVIPASDAVTEHAAVYEGEGRPVGGEVPAAFGITVRKFEVGVLSLDLGRGRGRRYIDAEHGRVGVCGGESKSPYTGAAAEVKNMLWLLLVDRRAMQAVIMLQDPDAML